MMPIIDYTGTILIIMIREIGRPKKHDEETSVKVATVLRKVA